MANLTIGGVEVPDLTVVKRKADPDKLYQILWLVEDGAKVRLCPADSDSVMFGARRTTVACSTFWRFFEVA